MKELRGLPILQWVNWVKESSEELPEDESEEPEFAELDELQTYIGRKTDKIWIWTVIDRFAPGIIAMEIGDRSGSTFNKLWQRIKNWNSRKYFTDGYCIYKIYIPSNKHQVLPKTQLTKVEGENTPVETLLSFVYIVRLYVTLNQFKCLNILFDIEMHYLRFKRVPIPA